MAHKTGRPDNLVGRHPMRDKSAAPACIFLLVLAIGINAAADNQPGTAWQVRPVVIEAKTLPGLTGSPREKLAAVIHDGGKIKPIPFQVDLFDADGNFVLGTPDNPMAEAAPEGPLGSGDELVFMAGDAGPRGIIPSELSPGYEVRVTDRAGGESGWVYVGTWTKGGPPRSKLDYVAYERSEKIEKIVTPHYVQTFNPDELLLSDLYILPPGGGNDKDVFDKLKMRTTITTIGGLSFSFDESDFQSKLTGIRDGPIRVIRRNETALEFPIEVAASGEGG